MNSEISNLENFVGSMYPRNFESDKTSFVNYFREEFERTCSVVWCSNALLLILTVKIGKKSENKMNVITVVLQVLTIPV